MFTPWVLDQQDRPDDVGRFAAILWSDINNGCGSSMIRDAVTWKKHFEESHPKTAVGLNLLLAESYTAYVQATTPVS